MTEAEASCLINWTNCLAAGCGAILLNYLGRRTLMISSQAFCIIGMFGMWIFQEIIDNEPAMYVMTIAFIFGFEFGPGPVVWLYLSEICSNKATSLNTVVNWIWTLVISVTTPIMFKAINGWTWFIFGCTCILGFIYLFLIMKETKGLPADQVKRLYHKNNGVNY